MVESKVTALTRQLSTLNVLERAKPHGLQAKKLHRIVLDRVQDMEQVGELLIFQHTRHRKRYIC